MMLKLFLDLRNTNFNDEQTLNFKCFTVNNIDFTNFKEFIGLIGTLITSYADYYVSMVYR